MSTRKLVECPQKGSTIPKNDILNYAIHLGIDAEKEPDLLWIAEEGLKCSVPEPWTVFEDIDRNIYYYNPETDVSSWEHPSDSTYRTMVTESRKLLCSASNDDVKSSTCSDSMSKLGSLANLPPISSIDRNTESERTRLDSKEISTPNKGLKTSANMPVPLVSKSISTDDKVDSNLQEVIKSPFTELKNMNKRSLLKRRSNLGSDSSVKEIPSYSSNSEQIHYGSDAGGRGKSADSSISNEESDGSSSCGSPFKQFDPGLLGHHPAPILTQLTKLDPIKKRKKRNLKKINVPVSLPAALKSGRVEESIESVSLSDDDEEKEIVNIELQSAFQNVVLASGDADIQVEMPKEKEEIHEHGTGYGSNICSTNAKESCQLLETNEDLQKGISNKDEMNFPDQIASYSNINTPIEPILLVAEKNKTLENDNVSNDTSIHVEYIPKATEGNDDDTMGSNADENEHNVNHSVHGEISASTKNTENNLLREGTSAVFCEKIQQYISDQLAIQREIWQNSLDGVNSDIQAMKNALSLKNSEILKDLHSSIEMQQNYIKSMLMSHKEIDDRNATDFQLLKSQIIDTNTLDKQFKELKAIIVPEAKITNEYQTRISVLEKQNNALVLENANMKREISTHSNNIGKFECIENSQIDVLKEEVKKMNTVIYEELNQLKDTIDKKITSEKDIKNDILCSKLSEVKERQAKDDVTLKHLQSRLGQLEQGLSISTKHEFCNTDAHINSQNMKNSAVKLSDISIQVGNSHETKYKEESCQVPEYHTTFDNQHQIHDDRKNTQTVLELGPKEQIVGYTLVNEEPISAKHEKFQKAFDYLSSINDTSVPGTISKRSLLGCGCSTDFSCTYVQKLAVSLFELQQELLSVRNFNAPNSGHLSGSTTRGIAVRHSTSGINDFEADSVPVVVSSICGRASSIIHQEAMNNFQGPFQEYKQSSVPLVQTTSRSRIQSSMWNRVDPASDHDLPSREEIISALEKTRRFFDAEHRKNLLSFVLKSSK